MFSAMRQASCGRVTASPGGTMHVALYGLTRAALCLHFPFPGTSPSDLPDTKKKKLPLSTNRRLWPGPERKSGSFGDGNSRRGCRSGVPDRRLDLTRSLFRFLDEIHACLRPWNFFPALTLSGPAGHCDAHGHARLFSWSGGPPATSSAFVALRPSAQQNLSASHGICIMRLFSRAPDSGLRVLWGSWLRGTMPRLVPESEGG